MKEKLTALYPARC